MRRRGPTTARECGVTSGREGPLQPDHEGAMERAPRQWAHDQPAHAVRRQRSFSSRLVPPRPAGASVEGDGPPVEPPQSESSARDDDGRATGRRRRDQRSYAVAQKLDSASCTATASVRRSTGSPTPPPEAARPGARAARCQNAANTSSITPSRNLPAPRFEAALRLGGRDDRTRQSAYAGVSRLLPGGRRRLFRPRLRPRARRSGTSSISREGVEEASSASLPISMPPKRS